MAIYLPGTAEEEQITLDELTPREIVSELDKYVIGQNAAKRAVAIALRNRMRRQKLAPELAEEVIPKNIIMIGPTGVGKTEIARRLAKLANSPFLKVEASKFTEVGYVGRDVESMIRDLVEIAIEMVREEKLEDVADKAELNAEERLLDILLPPTTPRPAETGGGLVLEGTTGAAESHSRTREKLRQQLREGKLDDRQVEIETRERNFPSFEIISNQGVEEMDVNIKDMLPNIFGQRTKKRKMKVNEAFEYLIQEEEQRLIDMEQVTRTAIGRVENSGIIFLDEIDKIAGRERRRGRLPRLETQRPDSRTSRPLPDPRGIAVAHHGRLHSDPHRAEIVSDQAIHRPARNRRRKARVHARCVGRNRSLCVPRERRHGEHRSPPPSYHHGACARRDQLRRAGKKRAAVHGRRGIRAEDAERDREGSGFVAVHFVKILTTGDAECTGETRKNSLVFSVSSWLRF